MKFLLRFLFLFCFLTTLKAQDTLIKKTGDTLIIRLTEIGIDEVRYKRFNYQEGPIFVIPKAEIRVIVFQNGTKENFDNYVSRVKQQAGNEDLSLQISGKYFYYKDHRLKEQDMLSVVYKLNDKGLNAMGRKIEKLRFGQNIAVICASTCFIYGFYTFQANQVKPTRGRGRPPQLTSANIQAQNRGKLLMLGGLLSGVVSVTFMLERRKHDRLIVDAYNKRIAKP